MEQFKLDIEPEIFRKTNSIWNELCLNDPWSLGYVSTLIESRPFASKEDWENFYYKSGKLRLEKINQLKPVEQACLNDYLLKFKNANQISQLRQELKSLNYYYGRTAAELLQKGISMHKHLQKQNIHVSITDCAKSVRFRSICETWNGIKVREFNTIKQLKSIFPEVDFKKTTGNFDHQFAIDYELKLNSKIIAAIQIKPLSYTYQSPYILKARNANKKKNADYTQLYKRPVFDVIAKSSGKILNIEVIERLKRELSGG